MNFSKLKLSVLCSVVAVLAVFICVSMVRADTGSNMYGYAWSSNIGWIKLNDCDDPTNSATCNPSASYGVTVLPSGAGTMSGYAWSSNIGWITFNSVGCPTTGCTPGAYADWAHPNSDGSVNIKGWARACSVFASGCSGALKDSSVLGSFDTSDATICSSNTDCNWDGFIALDSTTGGGTGGSWGLKINKDDTVTGYSWGSEVIGWIHSINIMLSTTGPTVSISTKNAIDSTTSCNETTITVTANNIDGANSCSFAGVATDLTMVQQPDQSWVGSITVSPPTTTTYVVNCTKGSRTATAQTTVQSTYFTSGSSSAPSSLTCNTTTNPDCAQTNSCGTNNPPSNGTGGNQPLDNYCANLNTNPSFAWYTDATSCSISQQGGASVTGLDGTSQAQGGTANNGFYYYSPNLPLESTSATYTLQCTGGSQPIDTEVTVPACTKSFQVKPSLPPGVIGNQNFNAPSQQLLPDSDGKNVTATFDVNIIPHNSFNSPVNLSIAWSGSTGAGDLVSTFVPVSISPSDTSVLTVTLPTKEAVNGDIFTGVITGVSGNLNGTAYVYLTVGATTETTPIYKEF